MQFLCLFSLISLPVIMRRLVVPLLFLIHLFSSNDHQTFQSKYLFILYHVYQMANIRCTSIILIILISFFIFHHGSPLSIVIVIFHTYYTYSYIVDWAKTWHYTLFDNFSQTLVILGSYIIIILWLRGHKENR